MRVLWKALLQQRGFDVSHCGDGPAAVWLAADLQPDAMVVDAGLPVWDGWTVVQRVNRAIAASRRIPVVFMSAYNGTVAEARARAAGCACYLQKPVDPAEVVYLLTELTGSRAAAAARPGAQTCDDRPASDRVKGFP